MVSINPLIILLFQVHLVILAEMLWVSEPHIQRFVSCPHVPSVPSFILQCLVSIFMCVELLNRCRLVAKVLSYWYTSFLSLTCYSITGSTPHRCTDICPRHDNKQHLGAKSTLCLHQPYGQGVGLAAGRISADAQLEMLWKHHFSLFSVLCFSL